MTSASSATGSPAAQPEWFAHRFDPDRNLFHLIPATRGQLRAATFLTDVNLAGARQARAVDRSATIAAAPSDAPLHFLFHSAFCCSTLLARALDGDGVALALKEPVLLNDVTGWRRRGAPADRVTDALRDALIALTRSARPGEASLVKPSNLFNPLAASAMTVRPRARAILLHAPLATFLASVASKQLEGRLWVRDLWFKMLKLGIEPFGFDGDALFRHTDLQVAALGWLAQHRLFADLAARFPDRVRTLSSERLVADPASVLPLAARHYNFAWKDDEVATVASGPLFTRHAKTGEAFGASERRALHRSAQAANADELEKVEHWARLVADAASIPMDLPLPLVTP